MNRAELIRVVPFVRATPSEFCFTQYMPISMKGEVKVHIPDNLDWILPIVEAALHLFEGDLSSSYVYATVLNGWFTGREGWHVDGFNSEDSNFIWYDSHPTEIIPILPHEGSSECEESLKEFEQFAEDFLSLGLGIEALRIEPYTVIDIDRFVHRVAPNLRHRRAFVKITFSDSKYNLQGNASNPLIDTKHWVMMPRNEIRNHPTKEV